MAAWLDEAWRLNWEALASLWLHSCEEGEGSGGGRSRAGHDLSRVEELAFSRQKPTTR